MKQQNNIALCAIGRMENQYAREFVQHYLALGFDHIYLYDNAHEGEERLEDVLGDFVADGNVTVTPWQLAQEDSQRMAYGDCYHRHGGKHTWMAFFDFDEFLVIPSAEALGTGTNKEAQGTAAGAEALGMGTKIKPAGDAAGTGAWDIHSFMQRYKGYDCLLVNWMDYTDGNLIENDGRPLQERFTVPMQYDKWGIGGDYPENNHAKSIVRTGIAGLAFKNPHVPNQPRLLCCNTRGQKVKQQPRIPYDHSIAYLKHYTTKTIGEWLSNKWMKGAAGLSLEKFRKDYAEFFFRINERTPEKEAYIEKWNSRKGRVAAVALGRMGNQMFIAAAAMTFARRTGREFIGLVYNHGPKFDYDYPQEQFETVMRNVKYIEPSEVAGFYHMQQGDYNSNGFPDVSEPDVVLCDYYQDNTCIDYEIALSLFAPYDSIKQEIKRLYGDLSDVVCVNVRRGDYLKVQRHGFRVLTKEQIEDMLEEHFLPEWRVLFVSDDIGWCRENFTGSRYLFADKPCHWKPEMDLYLMTQCGAGCIIANSTFSWWGAYLSENGIKVVCPWPWFDSPKRPAMTNLLPASWIKHGKEWKIWLTYHKPELIREYHLDCIGSRYELFDAQQDPMNSCMSEFVTMRHIWQRGERSDFVGFCHYRRILNVSRLPQRGECQVLRRIRFPHGETMYEQYRRCHNIKDYDLLLSLIDGRLGKGNPYSNYLRTSTTMLPNVCFLMAWKDFMLMADFVLYFLKRFAEATGCGEDVGKWHDKAVADFCEADAPYQQRLLGFLGERLVSAWITINLKWYI